MLGPGLALLSFGIAILAGAIVGVVFIILGRIAPTPAPGSGASTSEGALQEMSDEELPPGRYMPFGPFLTASAVLVALLPGWIMVQVQYFWHWYLHLL